MSFDRLARTRPGWLNWVVTLAILIFAAALRLWTLGRPDTLVFDELYYVRDAVSQLTHGFATTWPDDEPEFGGERARAFSDVASTVAHPPLGKWLIGLGILLFGPDTGWGWRISVALAGVATVGVTMRVGWLLTKNLWVAWFAGLLLAVDGVHIVMSRVSLLDGFLTFFVMLGALFIAHDQLQVWRQSSASEAHRRHAVHWRRPWLLAAAVTFGAAAAVKWSGLYAFAAFLLLITLADLLRRIWREDRGAWAKAIAQGLVTALIALPAALLTYVASWLGWILNPAGYGRSDGESWVVSLLNWHRESLFWHTTLDSPHPYQAPPLSWPLALRPTAMYRVSDDEFVTAVTAVPNALVTWAGVLALLILAWVVLHQVITACRARSLSPIANHTVFVCAFLLTGYLSGILPWIIFSSRSAVYQFYAVVLTPFSALALAVLLAAFAATRPSLNVLRFAAISLDDSPGATQGHRYAVAIFLGAAVVLAVLFWPLWSGAPVPTWFYQLHLWLPGWV